MPSPIGHALAGITAGWMVCARGPYPRGAVLASAVMFGIAASVPDADLLTGLHRGPTHGVGAAAIAGVAAWAACSWVVRRRDGAWVRAVRAGGTGRLALAVAVAYATHTLLDWLGTDTSPPIGVMALWPFSRDFFESRLHLFMAISRRPWLPGFWSYNLRAVGRELAILLPALAVVVIVRTWRGRSSDRER